MIGRNKETCGDKTMKCKTSEGSGGFSGAEGDKVRSRCRGIGLGIVRIAFAII